MLFKAVTIMAIDWIKNIPKSLTSTYIKKLKKKIVCPVCGASMHIDNTVNYWMCDNCDYTLSVAEFENNYVLWFCDECNEYLNVQKNFSTESGKWTCTECGHENDVSENNIRDICKHCGKVIPENNKSNLCPECKTENMQKWLNRFKKSGKVLSTIAVVAGILYLIANASKDDSTSFQDNDFPNDNDNHNENKKKYKVIMHYSDGTSEEEDEIFDTEEDAEDHALYAVSCANEGAEILHLSNPGDYPIDEYENPDYEIIEVDE